VPLRLPTSPLHLLGIETVVEEHELVRLIEEEGQLPDQYEEPDHLQEALWLLREIAEFLEKGLSKSLLSERANRKVRKLTEEIDEFTTQFD
jgi:hypothetical protein